MKRGDNVRLTNGEDKGIVLLTTEEVEGFTLCMVGWGDGWTRGFPRYTWERMEDLVLC